jgi:UDP-N-acetylglucosamine acyltransferase
MSTLIHPTAIIGSNVIIEDDVYIGPYCIIGMPPEWKGKESENKGVIIRKGTTLTGLVTVDTGAERTTEIGPGCYIMKHAYIAHDCILGSNVTMSAGSKLAGFCTVGDKVNLGMGAAVHQKSTLPDGIMIGMNGVVTKKSKLEPYQKYAGVPVKNIGSNERAKNNN